MVRVSFLNEEDDPITCADFDTVEEACTYATLCAMAFGGLKVGFDFQTALDYLLMTRLIHEGELAAKEESRLAP